MDCKRHVCFVIPFMVMCAGATVSATEIPIAGAKPSQRPANAPVLSVVNHPGEWYSQALHGVDRPYPHSLRFLEDQGNWHTPFNRPGMLYRYDIRGWHRK